MNFSIGNLEALSRHDKLKPYVRQLVFMRPQFEDTFRDREDYREALVKSVTHLFEKFLEAAQGTTFAKRQDRYLLQESEAREIAEDQAYDLCNSVLNRSIAAGHEQYLMCLDEQEALLASGRYVEHGAVLLSRFTNLTSILVCGSEGGLESYNRCGQKVVQETFLQRRYPLLQMGREHVIAPANTTFLANVFRLLALSQAKPSEVVFTSGIYVSSRLIEQPLRSVWQELMLEGLESLRLTLGVERQGEEQIRLTQLLGQTIDSTSSTLQTLSLQGPKWRVSTAHITLNAFLNRPFSTLTHLNINRLVVNGVSVSRLVASTTTLESMRFSQTSLMALVWRKLMFVARLRSLKTHIFRCKYGSIRAQAQAAKANKIFSVFEFLTTVHDSGEVTRERDVFEDEDNDLRDDLESYLWKDGPWNTRLINSFGILEESEPDI